MSHVFISYSRKDKVVVGKFVEALRKQDFIVWQDVSNISAGDDWRQAIYRAIEEAAVFIIFWSQSASLSAVVKEEIDYAIAQNKPIIPIWLEKDTPLSADLAIRNAILTRAFTPKLTEALLNTAPRIQRQISELNLELPMTSQTVPDIARQIIGGKEYVVIPLIQSAYSKAVVIAEANTIPARAKRIQLMVQCTGAVGYGMVNDAFSIIQKEDAEFPDEAEPLVGLYITGPTDLADPTKYTIDVKNVAHYSDLNDTIQKAIYLFTMNDRNKVFQLFLQMLVDIAFLFGVEANRWIKFQLYRIERGVGYTRIMDIGERLPQ
ncbi:MAG: toll/interleukin-1 receptor domain-containing protein [Anaerolineae bacterium]|nr:toll/interleukin-1 receptor domain-containing protein [Anaerolineae bacterium]